MPVTSDVGLGAASGKGVAGAPRPLNGRSIIQLLKDIVQSPQFWDGIKVFGIGAAIAGSKWLFDTVLNTVKSLILSRAILRGDDDAFEWAMLYVRKHSDWDQKAREVEVSTKSRLNSGGSNPDEEEAGGKEGGAKGSSGLRGVYLFPIESTSIHFVFKGIHVFATRARSLVGDSHFEETLHLSFLTLSSSTIRDFIAAARQSYELSERGRITVYRVDRYNYWSRSRTITRRLRDSVYLPAKIKERVLADARQFMSEETRVWYGDRGIPYRRGYLFYGKPGSGKTSLAHVLASELERPIYQLTLSGAGIDDAKFAELMSSVPSGAILVLEDVDCAFMPTRTGGTQTPVHQHDDASGSKGSTSSSMILPPGGGALPSSFGGGASASQPSSSISFSGLLNAIDGISAGESRILVMTTNHRERLDDALIRPGRIDMSFAFGNATQEQARELFVRWFAPIAAGDRIVAAPAASEDDDDKVGAKEGTPMTPISSEKSQSSPVQSKSARSLARASLWDNTHGPLLAEITAAAERFATATPSGTHSVAALQGFLLTRRNGESPAQTADAWIAEVRGDDQEGERLV